MNKNKIQLPCMFNVKIVSSWPLLLCLALLLLNDFYLKMHYPGWITGKLSDFSGLALVALLVFSTALPFRFALLLLVSLFCWWKSPWSQFFIDFLNSLSTVQFGRVIDYSDLFALAVLPLAKWIVQDLHRFTLSFLVGAKPVPILVVTACLFAIMATSAIPTRQSYHFEPVSKNRHIDSQQFIAALQRALQKFDVSCSNCDPASPIKVLLGRGCEVQVKFSGAMAQVSVRTMPSGVIFGESAAEKAEQIRRAIKAEVSNSFDGLQYVEPL